MKKSIIFSFIILVLSACNNQEFPDFDYSTVYFAYQYPVRTLTMGEDLFDTSLDNAHKCKIMATWGGGYTNKKNVVIDFSVDNSLCDNLLFSDSLDLFVMPSNYYELASNQITIPSGAISGGVEVQLTDAFFADPLALGRNYVIPVVMNQVQNADSILRGKTSFENTHRCNPDDWDIVPKDYILYCIKYINAWDAYYLRRGTDAVVKNGVSGTEERRHSNVEDDEICKLNTLSLSQTEFSVTYKTEGGIQLSVPLVLSFNDNNECTISANQTTIQAEDASLDNIVVQGNGKFVKAGEKNSWGKKDRNALYLDYNISFDVLESGVTAAWAYNTKDTLVLRDRGVKMETFEVVMK